MMRTHLRALLCLLLGAPSVATAAGEPFRLRLPLACEPGRTCFVQYYVDRDTGPGARDYTCGSRSYDRHNGTDIRLLSLKAEAGPTGKVLAAAPGKVLRLRNDAPDVSVRETGVERVAGVECGNGAVIAHADGYETQYCHLAKGSLSVKPGDLVEAGQPIGQAGLSGATEFPHLHFTVRRAGTVIDPFEPDTPEDSCDAGARKAVAGLWDSAAREALVYRAGAVLNSGFASGPVTMPAIETEATGAAGPDGAYLVAWIRTIGLDAGDVRRLSLTGPDGRVLAENTEPALPRPQAQSLQYVGKKRPAEGFAPGTYTATFALLRGGAVALEHRFVLTMPPR